MKSWSYNKTFWIQTLHHLNKPSNIFKTLLISQIYTYFQRPNKPPSQRSTHSKLAVSIFKILYIHKHIQLYADLFRKQW